jgi:uncharacterized protein
VFRLLIGMTLHDTGGSVLAVAILHGSFIASQKLGAVPEQWPTWVALVVLLVLTAVFRRRGQARLDDRGYASAGSVSTLTR